NNYGVTFRVFKKISVKGNNKHPIYKWLSNKELNGRIDKEPSWNFCKYLVDSEGKLLYYFGSSVEPLSSQITAILD
ncbi:MAG TPA: glutathione peroxidase, partial [Candidatus Marinimicrobia bacterium]|nr:glutathione peroxidase [Candidatus Neomarinimicrobiota bacterium]